jgi:ABC-type nitrate/sulfonate/bicarbonate transport system permease component
VGKLLTKLRPFFAAFILIMAAEIVVRAFAIEPWIFPAPSAVLIALYDTAPLLMGHMMATLGAAALGMAASLAAGLVLGYLVFSSSFLKGTLYPALVASQSLPTIVVAPLLILWFGFGALPKVMLVVLACFFPISVGVVDGLSSVDPELVEMAMGMDAKPSKLFWKVRWPAALPYIFTGIRVSATYAIIATVVSEWMGSQKGLGVYLTRASHSFRTDRVFAVLVVITLLSMGLFSLVNLMSRKLSPWYYQHESDTWEVEK